MSHGNDASYAIGWKIQAVIEQSGYVDRSHARDLMHLILHGISSEFGGGDLYIKKCDKSHRNDRIRDAFDGSNATDICRKFRVSKATVYRIIGEKNEA